MFQKLRTLQSLRSQHHKLSFSPLLLELLQCHILDLAQVRLIENGISPRSEQSCDLLLGLFGTLATIENVGD